MASTLLLSHPTGNANVRAAARAFHSARLLKEFHSCICWNSNSTLASLIPSKYSNLLNRRSFEDIPYSLQYSHPFREVLRVLGPRWPRLRRHETGYLSVDSIYRSFDHYVSLRLPKIENLKAIYAYEDGALQSFQMSHQLGITCIYDLPIGYWQAAKIIFEEERDLQPEWSCTMKGLNDSEEKFKRKDSELALADHVIVPSDFVKSTLIDHNATSAPISVVPFGSPNPINESLSSNINSPLRVLFVGSLTQRKGLSYALEAIDLCGEDVKLTLIGKVSNFDCKPLLSAITTHKWIKTLPHHLILDQMRNHDVLLLPSLFEGYALVISEALSQGLPVITTVNSGASSIVRDGIEGYIVPIRDSESIAEKLLLLASDRDKLQNMKKSCITRSSEFSWSKYEKDLLSSLPAFN